MATRKKSTPPDFDKALKELEALVEKLENEDLSLEQSVDVFEQGISLSKACQTALEAAELRVRKILDTGAEDTETASEATDDDSQLPF